MMMIKIDIPGYGLAHLEHLVLDFNGTLSADGTILPGVKEQLKELEKVLELHVVAADTYGRASLELKDLKCTLRIVSGVGLDLQKEEYVRSLGPERVVAIGNGNNDRRMLKLSGISIAVTGAEGCVVNALLSANIHVNHIHAALDLLINPLRLEATLRYW